MIDVLQRIWIDNDLDAIDDIYQPDAEIHGMVPGTVLGPREFREVIEQYSTLSRLDGFTIHDVFVDSDDRAAFRITLQVTSFANGRTAPQDCSIFMTLRDGRIAATHNYVDLMGYFEMVGALPEHTAYMLLAGGTFK
ncbi:Ketosteroid isomerase-related protein [Tropicibacter naphthalenivorans]|uniref:Ketosteroid isomerase-related protein n=2 Tax=Tropicibacter naphthalenivorans TaxID=441103 RepID=A0A0P1G7H3_9RHOB|nr:Ketosteroid isomerase-related protein [Tropicibacter naphthalenivorans]SMC56437.1 Ketosteroid isomerase-related protein [Tropicibacter naphthalenivorans]